MKFLFTFPIDTMRFLQGRLNMTDFSKGLVAALASQFIVFHAVSVMELDASG